MQVATALPDKATAHSLKVLWLCELLNSVTSVSVSSTGLQLTDTSARHPSDLEGSRESRMHFVFPPKMKDFQN